jgi:hypothetical protein
MPNAECRINDEVRSQETVPALERFVIRASGFFRHSKFVLRHFKLCRSYDGKVAEARADFQMEIRPRAVERKANP